MNALQSSKVLIAKGQGTAATNATARYTVARGDAEYAKIIVSTTEPTATNASATFAALKIQHGDGTNYTTVPGFDGTTATATSATSQFIIGKSNVTGAPLAYEFNVDLRNTSTEIGVYAQPNTNYNDFSVVVLLGRKGESPDSAPTGGTDEPVTRVVG